MLLQPRGERGRQRRERAKSGDRGDAGAGAEAGTPRDQPASERRAGQRREGRNGGTRGPGARGASHTSHWPLRKARTGGARPRRASLTRADLDANSQRTAWEVRVVAPVGSNEQGDEGPGATKCIALVKGRPSDAQLPEQIEFLKGLSEGPCFDAHTPVITVTVDEPWPSSRLARWPGLPRIDRLPTHPNRERDAPSGSPPSRRARPAS